MYSNLIESLLSKCGRKKQLSALKPKGLFQIFSQKPQVQSEFRRDERQIISEGKKSMLILIFTYSAKEIQLPTLCSRLTFFFCFGVIYYIYIFCFITARIQLWFTLKILNLLFYLTHGGKHKHFTSMTSKCVKVKTLKMAWNKCFSPCVK